MKSLDTIVNTLMGSIPEQKKTEAYDTPAEVRRVEDGIAWVHIPGGVDETPVKMTINAKPGEIVQVRVSNGQAFMVGNASAPPTDDSTAIKALNAASTAETAAASAVKSAGVAAEAAANAQQTADSVRGIAEQAMADAAAASSAAAQAQADATAAGSAASAAQTSADSAASAASAAQTSANAAGEAASRAQAAADAAQGDIDNQQEYFWHDSLGAHVLSDIDEVTGMRYRTDLKGAGQEIFELDGTTETSVAKFGADGVRIGQKGGYYVKTTEDGVGIYDPSQRVLQIAANSQSPDFPKAILLGEGLVSIIVWNNGSGVDVYNRYDFMGADGLSDAFGRYVRDVDLSTKVLDVFYPVGSYYETSDPDFDPNTAWGGTWVLEAEGLAHISAGNNYVAGNNYGANDVTLGKGNIPRFTGAVNLASNIARNNITNPPLIEAASGVLSMAQRTGRNAVKVATTTIANNQTIYDTINLALGSEKPSAVSVMQESIAVNRWHRTE